MSKESWLEEKQVRATFHSINGVGSRRLRQLIALFGSAVNAWYNLEKIDKDLLKDEPWIQEIRMKRKELNPQEIEEQLAVKGIRTVIPEEEGYPHLLRELPDAPPLLYYKGELTGEKEALAIVGARRATPYGRAAAESIAKECAQHEIVVVSGLARGIDTSAHKGALAGKGITWAILGCGLEFMYPPENAKLAQQIIEAGGALFSEFMPQTSPLPQFFPMRNRLISGMSRGVVVVEAAVKSGALITVDFALEQGREVFAVPGPIFSEQSKGSNHLIRQGAKLIEGIQDILPEIPSLKSPSERELQMSSEANPSENVHPRSKCTPEQEELLQLFGDLPIHIDHITLNSHIPPEQIPLVLLELQLAGLIEQLPGQLYVLAHKC
jgi:DNA processing protein